MPEGLLERLLNADLGVEELRLEGGVVDGPAAGEILGHDGSAENIMSCGQPEYKNFK